jgi:hypothetical protein
VVGRLHVARDDRATVVSRTRLRMPGARRLIHPWPALIETVAGRPLADAESAAAASAAAGSAAAANAAAGWAGSAWAAAGSAGSANAGSAGSAKAGPAGSGKPALRPRRLWDSIADPATIVLPPVLAGAATAAFGPVEAGFAVGGGFLLAMSALAPRLRRRLASRSWAPKAALVLTSERATFQRLVTVADRISETWPALGSLVNPDEAEHMLAEALWEAAGVLARRQALTDALAELSRPDFAAPAAEDPTTRELTAELTATKSALAEIDSELARREANLRRAEQAGRAFIRDQQMRRAIRSAEKSRRIALPAAPDAAAELADRTRSVLTAYRELTADLTS